MSPPPLPPSPPSLPPSTPPPNVPPLSPSPPSPPPEGLSAGDCMVVDFQSAPRTDFGVVLLESLGPGQTITVTNDGWGPDQVTGAFDFCSKHITTYADGRQTLSGNQEASFMTYTPSTDVPAGTVLRPSDFNGTLSFNVGSDQLLVYHGSISAPP
eukprot:7385166-Prymnesium_polylepis.1